MEIDCSKIKRKQNALDWGQLLPEHSSDDDRPAELVIVSKKNLIEVGSGVDSHENHVEDVKLRMKSDRDISDDIARLKKTLQSVAHRLLDKGEKIKANLRRHELELERRKKLQSEKAVNGHEASIQLTDHSDVGASHGKRKSPSMFAKSFYNKFEEDKDSRTVSAFETDLFYMKPCQGRRLKSKSQIMDKGTRSLKNPVVDSKKHIITNDDNKDGDTTTAFSKTKPPQDSPSRNLRSRSAPAYHLVDEEPPSQKFMEDLDPCFKDVKVYYPSRDDPDAVEVNFADMACLGPEACITSVIMNFYIRYLQQPSSSYESAICNYHFFNTYFYNKLEKLSYKEDTFRKFRKWWKGVTLFEKAYILLPVHEDAHWSLLIICLPNNEDELGPILLHLDSLGLHDSMSLFDNVKRFLKEEWSHLRKTKSLANLLVPNEIWENVDRRVDCRSVMVPQQKNDYDCGLFVLYYIEQFIKEAPDRFVKKDLSKFSRQWFHPQEASNLRAKIYKLLVEEFKKAKKESIS